MKRGMKRIVVLLLAFVMIFAFAACKDETADEPNTTKVADDKTSEAVVTAEPVEELDFETITFLVLGNKPINGRMEAVMEEVNAIFGETLNAELVLQYVEWADWQTQYNLVLASGDPTLDLIGTATDWLNAWENTKKGSFLALSDEMIATYAPKTWEAVPASHWDECRYEGDIYFFPEDQYAQWTNHGMYYRGDWAAEAGLDVVGNFEQLEAYFDGVVENHPDVIPWDAAGSSNLGGLAEGYINSTTMLFDINGVSAGNWRPFFVDQADPYTVVCPYVEGTILEDFAVMVDRWAEKGFWREDVLNYTGETRDLMYAGQTAADQHHTETFIGATRPTMDEKQPGSELQMFPYSMPSKNLVKDIVTHGACAVSASSQHPERALMVYDMLRNDETVYRLYNYGIEGEDYIVTEDGKLDRPEGYDSTTMSLDINFWYGRNDTLGLTNATHYEGKQAIYDEYNTYAIDYPLGKFIFDKSTTETTASAINEVFSTYLPTIAWGKTEDPVATVAEFQQALKDAGLQEMLDEIQSQLDDYKAAGN